MTLQRASDLQHQQQNSKEQQNAKAQQQDTKNVDYLRQVNQPNHPNT